MRLFTKNRGFLFCTLLIFTSLAVSAQSKLDSLQQLKEVVVTEKYKDMEIRATAPLQILSSKALANINALQLSDAVKHFSGVTVKDYGGVGGLKTISVRSLGANHTAVSYDGITLTDAQTGQIDLGRFSLDNVDMLSLNSGQSDRIFQPARLFASGSVLSIETKRPKFNDNKKTAGKFSIKTGSWGLANPAFLWEQKIGNKLSSSISGEWMQTNGKYPYLLYYTHNQKDSSSVEQRQNTDVKNFRIEGALFADLSKKENADFKVYYYQSNRGLPGATIYYNTQNFSSQRLSDNTFFVQGSYTNDFSQKWALKANIKYNRGYMRYLDPTYLNEKGETENNYTQQEYYASAAILYRAFKNISFSLSNDIAYSDLKADLYNFSYPTRITNLTALAGKFVSNQLLITASILSTIVDEDVKTGTSAKNYKQLSPYASISVKPFKDIDFRLRMFYKNIFRMPSFNDLYYSRIGNPNLNPEKTNQFNIGATARIPINKIIPLISVTVDAYHNGVTDKIVAYPTKNIFVWTILNYGKVDVNGLDATLETAISLSENYRFRLNGNYSYQKALNITNPKGREYKHQVPYTPRVSGSSRLAFEMPYCTLAYSVLWSGKRYILNQNYAENRLSEYADHSIMISGNYSRKNQSVVLNLEILNLLNENYAIVRYFPMPGRSWRMTLSYKF